MTTQQSINTTTSTETPVEVVAMSGPVEIDDAARERFTRGQCHAFAWELSQATGWKVAALIEDSCCFSNDMDECASDDVYPGVCGCQV